jgi:hypothetical protein
MKRGGGDTGVRLRRSVAGTVRAVWLGGATPVRLEAGIHKPGNAGLPR